MVRQNNPIKVMCGPYHHCEPESRGYTLLHESTIVVSGLELDKLLRLENESALSCRPARTSLFNNSAPCASMNGCKSNCAVWSCGDMPIPHLMKSDAMRREGRSLQGDAVKLRVTRCNTSSSSLRSNRLRTRNECLKGQAVPF